MAASSFAAMRRCTMRPTRAASICMPACATRSAAGSCGARANAAPFRWCSWPTCRRRWTSMVRCASSTCWPISPQAWHGRPGATATASVSSAATSAFAASCRCRRRAAAAPAWPSHRTLRAWRPLGRSARALHDAHRHLPRQRALVFLVSDFHLPLADVAQVLASLAAHDVVPVVLWQPAEFALSAERTGWPGCRSPRAENNAGCGGARPCASAGWRSMKSAATR